MFLSRLSVVSVNLNYSVTYLLTCSVRDWAGLFYSSQTYTQHKRPKRNTVKNLVCKFVETSVLASHEDAALLCCLNCHDVNAIGGHKKQWLWQQVHLTVLLRHSQPSNKHKRKLHTVLATKTDRFQNSFIYKNHRHRC